MREIDQPSLPIMGNVAATYLLQSAAKLTSMEISNQRGRSIPWIVNSLDKLNTKAKGFYNQIFSSKKFKILPNFKQTLN